MLRDPPFPAPVRRFIFKGVPLIPADEAGKSNVWILPGGEGTATTQELYAMGREEGVHAFLFERYAIGEIER